VSLSAETAAPPARKIPFIVLLAIFLLAFAFLVHWLDFTSLWADEGWTIQATNESNPIVTVRDWVAVDVHPPLFFIGLDGWRLFTGDTIFELRYYSVMLSMLGVAVMFRLGQAVYSIRAGLLAALFYGLHDLVKVLTQEVRHYPQQMLMVAVVLWMYWRFWQKPTRSKGVIFAVAGAALLYTHYWGGFVLLGLAVHALITARKHLRPFIFTFLGIGLLFAPWIPVLIQQITLERPGGLPHALENNRTVYAVLIYQFAGVPELFWIVMCAAGLVGSFALIANGKRDNGGFKAPRRLGEGFGVRALLPTPASLLPLPIIILAPLLSIALNTVYPTLSFRSLAVIVPAVMLLAAHGVSRFRMPEQSFIIAFIILYSLSKTSAQPLERPSWPQIADYLAAHTTAQDAVLLELDTDVDPMAYYLKQENAAIHFYLTERVRELEPERYPTFLNDALAAGGGAWVAQFGWEAEKDIRPWLNGLGYELSAPVITLLPPDSFGAVPPGGTPFRYNDGRPIMLWRLDRPPQSAPLTTFGENLRLLSAEVMTHENNITVNLLWSPLNTPEQDYTVSAILLANGVGAANHDSAPLDGLSPTLSWQPDGLYFDSHAINTANVPAGDYQVGIQVYRFTDESFTQIENLRADDCTADADCRFIVVGTVRIE